jgi:hypothetical protein
MHLAATDVEHVRRQHMRLRLEEHDQRGRWARFADELYTITAEHQCLLITTPGDDQTFQWAFDHTRAGCRQQLHEQAHEEIFGNAPIEWFWIVDMNTNRGRKLRFL